MRFEPIDEQAAEEYFRMLKDAPSIKEIISTYPGVENLIHVMTAQICMRFILPFLENELSVEDLHEAVRRYLITALAFGIILHKTDDATNYVLKMFQKEEGPEEEQTG